MKQQLGSPYKAFLGFFLAILSLSVAAKEMNNDDPQQLFTDATRQLILELKKNSSQIKKNKSIAYNISDRLIVPYLDFQKITQLVVGKHWRRASNEQKAKLTEEIRQMLIRSYVTAMTTYADQIVEQGDNIKYKPSRYKTGDRKATIDTTIQLLDGKTADVNYKLYNSKQGWKIYDIRVAGISLTVTYRTSFSAEIKQSGIDGLIARLEQQNKSGYVELPESVKKMNSSASNN
ncbi:MAG: ABC transporter substrate-binding protein [Gammaproteobacteria bacterium]